MLIFDYIYILGIRIPTITFFVLFGILFWFFVIWRESNKDGFLHRRFFDASIIYILLSTGAFFGLRAYYNWNSLYRPNTWLLQFNRYIIFTLISYLLCGIIFFILSKKQNWSVFRIMDIVSTSMSFFLFSFSLGMFLIYSNTSFILLSLFMFIFYVLLLRLRGYRFKSGYLYSYYLIFLSLLVVLLFREPGYLLFCLVLFSIGVLNFVYRRRVIMDKKSLPQELLDTIKNKLMSKDEKLKQEELLLKEEDPYLQEGRAEGNSDEVDEAVLEDRAKEVLDSRMNIIQTMRNQIQKALSKITMGSYGKCEVCGNDIDKARLKAYPEATTCLSCANKTGK